MKKLIMLLFVVLLSAIVGCNNGQELISFNNEELSKELKNEGVEPKLPTQFPMEVNDYEIQLPPHKSSIYPVMFKGKGVEIFNLRIHSGDVSFHGEFEKEDVKVNGNEGFYTEDDVAGLDLSWADGDYYYILNYQTIGLNTEVTKETMVRIAESFK